MHEQENKGYNTLVLSLATTHPLLHRCKCRCGAVQVQANNGESQLVPNESIEIPVGGKSRVGGVQTRSPTFDPTLTVSN